MGLLLAWIGLSFVCLYIVYLYMEKRKQCQQLMNNVTAYQHELEKLKETEQNLSQESSILQNKLTHVAEDPLTTLLGWQLFEDRLQQNIHESARYHLSIAVFAVDIDDFKVVNQALGQQVGDELLQVVAKRIQSCIRQVDSAARFAKDTFYVLLTQLNKPETAAIVAQRILHALSEPTFVNEEELYITACVGIAIFPADGNDTATLLRNANDALHMAKEKGKNKYQFYQEHIHANSQRELNMMTALRRETLFQELAIYYQPIINVDNEKIVCLDAELQWQHPAFGGVMQQELFDYAGKQNKLNQVSEWLLREACKQFQVLRKSGVNAELLGIPLHLKQLENNQFIYHISQILQDLQFNPEWLMLELVDTSSFSQHWSFDILEKPFNMLKYLKVKLAIKNFGRSSFSLLDLKKLTIHYLKLDPSFAEDVGKNEKVEPLIKSVLFLADSLSLQLVISGVEKKDQVLLLKNWGATLMQGAWFPFSLPEKEQIT